MPAKRARAKGREDDGKQDRKKPGGQPVELEVQIPEEEETSTADFLETEAAELEDEAEDDDVGSTEDVSRIASESDTAGEPKPIPSTSTRTSQYELRPLDPSVREILADRENPPDKDITEDKLQILENAKKSAKLASTRAKESREFEDSSDSQDCTTCFICRKQKKGWKEIAGDEKESRGKLIRWIVKWLVFIIGLGNFVQAVHDAFNLLQFQMKFDYFFAIGVYNCKEWVFQAYQGLLFVYTAHGMTSVLLLFGNSKSTARFTLYWIATQVLLSATNIMEGFFKFRFAELSETKKFLVTGALLVLLDILEISVVLLRFYLLDRPYQLRLKRLAASARQDRTLNGELFLRASMFLQRKSAIREAANFQILAVIKKLREEYNTTGMRAPPEVVAREVQEALNALKDQSKYPGLKRLKQAEKARRRMSETPAPKLKKPQKSRSDNRKSAISLGNPRKSNVRF